VAETANPGLELANAFGVQLWVQTNPSAFRFEHHPFQQKWLTKTVNRNMLRRAVGYSTTSNLNTRISQQKSQAYAKHLSTDIEGRDKDHGRH